MKNIAAALLKAQKQFSPALKTSTNPHYKSKYADLSACVEAVIDALNEAGIFLMQKSHECATGVLVETLFIHESGEVMDAGKLHVPAAKADPQGYGSALTYARRYSLMAACGIAPEDDDGNASIKTNRKLTASETADHISCIEGAATIDDLGAAYKQAYKHAKSVDDTAALLRFETAKDKMKNRLSTKEA